MRIVNNTRDRHGNPWHAVFQREEFLAARAKQLEWARGNPSPIIPGMETVVVEPGDDVICDDCNELIEQEVHVVNYGSRAACEVCLHKWLNPEAS